MQLTASRIEPVLQEETFSQHELFTKCRETWLSGGAGVGVAERRVAWLHASPERAALGQLATSPQGMTKGLILAKAREWLSRSLRLTYTARRKRGAYVVRATAEVEVVANKLRLVADEVVELIEHMGGCIATNRIMIDGLPVGSMVRDVATGPQDSGWLFMAGDESQAYLDDEKNLAVYEVNTVASCDPSIIPFLYALPGQCFDRDPRTQKLIEAPDSAPDSRSANLPPGVSVVQGQVLLSEDWHLQLPTPFRRRREQGSLVLWRPALTFWIDVADHDARSPSSFLEARLADLPRKVTHLERSERALAVECSFRLRSASAACPTLHSFIVGPQSYVHVHAYFDHEFHAEAARSVLASVRVAQPFGLH
jgi:hypothetical protein